VADWETVYASWSHGRFSGIGRPAAWVAADVIRFEDGLLAEHWDVLQDEATQAESISGLPMFGDRFPAQREDHTPLMSAQLYAKVSPTISSLFFQRAFAFSGSRA
jgi:hypothetical protein